MTSIVHGYEVVNICNELTNAEFFSAYLDLVSETNHTVNESFIKLRHVLGI